LFGCFSLLLLFALLNLVISILVMVGLVVCYYAYCLFLLCVRAMVRYCWLVVLLFYSLLLLYSMVLSIGAYLVVRLVVTNRLGTYIG
jgi:hypothetical protein